MGKWDHLSREARIYLEAEEETEKKFLAEADKRHASRMQEQMEKEASETSSPATTDTATT